MNIVGVRRYDLGEYLALSPGAVLVAIAELHVVYVDVLGLV